MISPYLFHRWMQELDILCAVQHMRFNREGLSVECYCGTGAPYSENINHQKLRQKAVINHIMTWTMQLKNVSMLDDDWLIRLNYIATMIREEWRLFIPYYELIYSIFNQLMTKFSSCCTIALISDMITEHISDGIRLKNKMKIVY